MFKIPLFFPLMYQEPALTMPVKPRSCLCGAPGTWHRESDESLSFQPWGIVGKGDERERKRMEKLTPPITQPTHIHTHHTHITHMPHTIHHTHDTYAIHHTYTHHTHAHTPHTTHTYTHTLLGLTFWNIQKVKSTRDTQTSRGKAQTMRTE